MTECCHKNSGFTFGLLLGAVVAALVAVVIYRQKDTVVFKKYKAMLQSYIKSLVKTSTNGVKVAKPKIKSNKNIITRATAKKFFKKK